MASKFMAFEGVASPSSYGDGDNERIEMNTTQYTNYQSNGNQEQQYIDTGPYGAVDNETDLNNDLEEKCEKSVGYCKFVYNNSEQLKSIFGGLLSERNLFLCCIHFNAF